MLIWRPSRHAESASRRCHGLRRSRSRQLVMAALPVLQPQEAGFQRCRTRRRRCVRRRRDLICVAAAATKAARRSPQRQRWRARSWRGRRRGSSRLWPRLSAARDVPASGVTCCGRTRFGLARSVMSACVWPVRWASRPIATACPSPASSAIGPGSPAAPCRIAQPQRHPARAGFQG